MKGPLVSRGRAATAVGAAALALAIVGCDEKKPTPVPASPSSASASASAAPAASAPARPTTSVSVLSGATPIPPAVVASVLNPSKLPVYEGPFGSVEGIVRYKGPPPETTDEKWPKKCGTLAPGFDKVFRVTSDGLLGDAIVGVTDYDGKFVPPVEEAAVIHIGKCLYDKRTLTLAFGQRVEVQNDGDVPAMPKLHGARSPAVMVAVPKGDPVRMYPQEIGRFELGDEMGNGYLRADVFVFKYATHGVTDTAGKFTIAHVPVGKVTVSARHPKFPQGLAKAEVEVKEGAATKVELTIELANDAAPKGSAKPKVDKSVPR